jgi:hypothetical protein
LNNNTNTLCPRQLAKTGAQGVAYLLTYETEVLHWNGAEDARALLLLTDAARYMLAADDLRNSRDFLPEFHQHGISERNSQMSSYTFTNEFQK